MAKAKTYSRADIEKLEMQKKELVKKIAALFICQSAIFSVEYGALAMSF